LLDLLFPGDPAQCYARLMCWLLQPAAEHGLGDDLLASLLECLEESEIDWPAADLADASTWLGATERRTGDRWEICLWARGKKLILVQEIFGKTDRVALTPYCQQNVPVVGLGLTKESFSSSARSVIPVWTYQDVLEALGDASATNGHTHLVVEFREHLRALLEAAQADAAPPPAAEDPKPAPSKAKVLAQADARARADALARAQARAHADALAHAEALARAEARAAEDAAEAAEPTVHETPRQKKPRAETALSEKPAPVKRKAKKKTKGSTGRGVRILKKQMDRLVEASEAEEAPVAIGDETTSLMAEMILSDDGRRAYMMGEVLGVGGQGRVFEAAISGDQDFEGFARPVERAVLKMGHADCQDALEREKKIYSKPDRGIIKLLDAGKTKRRSYLILERLHSHPYERFAVRVGRVDLATAIDTFVNLLDILKGIHSPKGRDMVLCDIKPDNIMLRLSSSEDTIEEADYLRRLATGSYEPVFIDVGCAQSVSELRKLQGRLLELIGTPLYLPPEAIPELKDGEFVPGFYSSKTDVYSLTLSFYEHLTGERPYAHRGLFQLRGEDHLREVFAFKRDTVNPINVEKLRKMFGTPLADEFQKILYAGLHADPDKRDTVLTLLQRTKEAFNVTERVKDDTGRYFYDVCRGLRFWQQRFPRIKSEKNFYSSPRV
jgi:serine/threonine protein kinase